MKLYAARDKNSGKKIKKRNVINVKLASQYSTGDIFVNGEIDLCMIRGER